MKISKKVVTTTEVDYDISPDTIVMTFADYPPQLFRDVGNVTIMGVEYSVVEVSQLSACVFPHILYEVKLVCNKHSRAGKVCVKWVDNENIS